MTLLVAAATYAIRAYLTYWRHSGETVDDDVAKRRVPTLLLGAVGGLLVGLTSVGSGSVIMVVLLLMHPRLSPVNLVGTDLIQAIPLVAAAALGHVIVTGVDPAILIPLIVLFLTGLGLFKVPPVAVGIIGAAMLTLGPVALAGLQRTFVAHQSKRNPS